MTPHRGLQDFHQLMRHRIMDILLVASPYDSFVPEEAGQIGKRVVGEFRNLDLHYGPGSPWCRPARDRPRGRGRAGWVK